LRELDASGQLRVGNVQVMNLKAKQLRAGLRAAGGRLALDPLAASLYEGRVEGRASVAAAATPRIGLDLQLSGIAIGPLLKDLAGRDGIAGRGNVTLDVTTAGATVGALTKALDGRAALVLKDGAVRGINIAQTLRQARAKLAGSADGTATAGEATDFSELTASFTITGGVARNDDLQAKTPLLRVGGSGEVDLGAGRLDYLVKATVVPTLEGQGGPELQALRGQTVPVKLSGPFNAIDWKIDFGSLARDAAKQQLERKLGGPLEEQAKEKRKAVEQEARQKLGDKLKGLLGR
jgi:AsmA protein